MDNMYDEMIKKTVSRTLHHRSKYYEKSPHLGADYGRLVDNKRSTLDYPYYGHEVICSRGHVMPICVWNATKL